MIDNICTNITFAFCLICHSSYLLSWVVTPYTTVSNILVFSFTCGSLAAVISGMNSLSLSSWSIRPPSVIGLLTWSWYPPAGSIRGWWVSKLSKMSAKKGRKEDSRFKPKVTQMKDQDYTADFFFQLLFWIWCDSSARSLTSFMSCCFILSWWNPHMSVGGRWAVQAQEVVQLSWTQGRVVRAQWCPRCLHTQTHRLKNIRNRFPHYLINSHLMKTSTTTFQDVKQGKM